MTLIIHFIIVNTYLSHRLTKYWELQVVIIKYVESSEILDLGNNRPIRNIGFNQSGGSYKRQNVTSM